MEGFGAIEEKDYEEAALVMARAFVDSPWYVWIFKDIADETERISALQWLFVRNMYMMGSKDASSMLCLKENGKLICCYILASPSARDASIMDMVWVGLLKIPFIYGIGTMNRLTSCLDFLKEHSNKTDSDSKNYFQLQRMVVCPSVQGKGIGSKCLKEGLKKLAPGSTVQLSTNLERNVQFYKRLGFKETDCFTSPNSLGNIKCWTMTLEIIN